MLAPGDAVPDFTLPLAYADGRSDKVQFSSLLGRGPIVLSFYPLAFTRVCTTQMCDARDHQAVYDALHATVIGFSIDTPWTNVEYAKSLGLRQGIYSDPNRDVLPLIWDMAEVAGIRNCAKRGWMVISPQGKVVALHVADKAGDPWVGTKPIENALRRATA